MTNQGVSHLLQRGCLTGGSAQYLAESPAFSLHQVTHATRFQASHSMHSPPLSLVSQRKTQGSTTHTANILQCLVKRKTPFACSSIQSPVNEDVIKAKRQINEPFEEGLKSTQLVCKTSLLLLALSSNFMASSLLVWLFLYRLGES